MSDATNPVVTYFEGTRWDYRHLWQSEKTGALHFGYYDAGTRRHVEAVRRMTGHLAGLAGITSADRVLDSGCGLGGCALWLAGNRGCSVTGVNITPYQVAAARESAEHAGAGDSVEFIEADVIDTGLPDGAFTVVWALESIVHVRGKAAFLREAHRVLRPGGRLMIAEYLLRDDPPLSDAEDADLRMWCDGWAMPGLLSEAGYRELLAESGFDGVEVVDISRNVAPSLRRLHRLIRLLAPTAPMFERLRILREVPADNLRASAAQIRTFDQGTWQYKVVLAERPTRQRDPGAGR
jgi:cyclopropane fatty-acyl-phospholipid synthase-like methyltransferase